MIRDRYLAPSSAGIPPMEKSSMIHLGWPAHMKSQQAVIFC